MRGCLITGTDTGVGKTVIAAAIVACLRARGSEVKALKPVVTGSDEHAGDWPTDPELLALVSGATPVQVAPISFRRPFSPHLAAELEGRPIDVARLRALIARTLDTAATVVIEGVGGLLVPLAEGYSVRELALDAGLPLIVAARPGLGTINHTLLTLEAARSAGLKVAGVVLTPWPERAGELECSNRATIARLGHVPVATLGPIARPAPELLAAAGSSLPLDDWLS